MATSPELRTREPHASAARKVKAALELVRPLNCLMLMSGVIVGGFLSAGADVVAGDAAVDLLVAALAVAAIGGGANSLNDVVDIDIDRINRPDRPIASGATSQRTGTAVWLIGSVLGIGLSATLSVTHVIVASAAAAALILYSLRLKRTVLLGNLAVAMLVGIALLFGSLAVGSASAGLYAAGFAFLLTFVREVVKDAADERGDRAFDARTFANVFGRRAAVRTATSVTGATILLTPLPFLISGYSTLYLSVVLVSNVLLLWAMWSASDFGDAGLSRSSNLLKWAMLVGMAALAAAHALE